MSTERMCVCVEVREKRGLHTIIPQHGFNMQ